MRQEYQTPKVLNATDQVIYARDPYCNKCDTRRCTNIGGHPYAYQVNRSSSCPLMAWVRRLCSKERHKWYVTKHFHARVKVFSYLQARSRSTVAEATTDLEREVIHIIACDRTVLIVDGVIAARKTAENYLAQQFCATYMAKPVCLIRASSPLFQ